MDGEKAFARIKREPEDDDHLIIDEDCTDDESEPPIKRMKVERVEPECPCILDPNTPPWHIFRCKFCR